MLSPKEYAEDHAGGICPNCESGEIEAGSIDMDGTAAFCTVTCATCEATWTDVFTLQYYTDLEVTDEGAEVAAARQEMTEGTRDDGEIRD